ncbi:MAG: DEAD/DEAH box helicase [Spirochaetota bacterium]|jgi:DEAD/DEAH box helicase domain-containing protein|nr:DEAD/DEAH box helicase [Spirochaetota bacterium]
MQLTLDSLRRSPSVCSIHTLPPREADYAPWPEEIPERLRTLLEKHGIAKLYTHQALACKSVLAGKHTVVVTPTASGKSLAYALPSFARILGDNALRALWLFPTKALAQDQTAAVNTLFAEFPESERLRVFTFDGDTPGDIRSAARARGQIVITNPDMLHTGILPNHPKWEKLFSGLAIVVIDEMHSYRGVFGSHLANVLRRLKRIAAYYGAHPVFILSSATIANPAELAAQLTGEEVTLITENGAPQAGREFIFWNPPLVDEAQGIRRGVVLESVRVAAALLRRNVQTIVFTRSRIHVELVASYLRKRLPRLANSIASYRGGYLPNERRRIERDIRSGDIRCVVATNALELGIDIGQLDAVVMAGYPGSVSSLLQRSGRAGRRDKASLAILIASSSPLDQYIVNNPDFIFNSHGEEAFVNPENLHIFLSHIKCSAFELNFADGERFGEQDLEPVMAHLEESRIVQYLDSVWHWTDRGYPAEEISLRSTTPGNIVIVNTASLDGSPGKAEIIGEMDHGSAFYFLHEGALYMHEGRHFEVERLDLDNGKAFVREVRAEYYTDAVAKTDIRILSIDDEQALAAPDEKHSALAAAKCPVGDGHKRGAAAPDEKQSVLLRQRMGDILVRTQVPKFKKIRFHTHENIGYGDIHLPEQEMHTRSCWIDMDASILGGNSPEEQSDTLIALANIIRSLAPVHILCAIHDIRTATELKGSATGRPTLYLFDSYHGGIGLSEKTYSIFPEIIENAARVLARCPCANGCPSCIGPPSVGQTNERHKELCTQALGRILQLYSAEK